jgi:hypothetical protein
VFIGSRTIVWAVVLQSEQIIATEKQFHVIYNMAPEDELSLSSSLLL